MLFDPQLNEAKQLIDVGDEVSAKAIVVPYLQKNPQSADAWWLFAILTDTDSDEVLALQRVLAIDPTHYEASRALEKLQRKLGIPTDANAELKDSPNSPPEKTESPQLPTYSSPPKSTLGSYEITDESIGESFDFPFEETSPPKMGRLQSETAARVAKFSQEAPNGMEAVAGAYSNYGWTAVQYSPQRTVMEKTTGIDWFWAVVALIIPFVGLTLLVANFFIRRTYTIVITSRDEGRKLHFSGDVALVTLDRDAIMAGTVSIPMPEMGTNYLTAIIIGGVASVVVICALCVGLLVLIDVEDDGGDSVTSLETGDTAYILSEEVRCIDVHSLPGETTKIILQMPKGEQVIINLRLERDDLDEIWYEVRSLSSGQIGWLPASNVGNELNNVSLPPEPCN
jgi:hypothetical protein